MLRQTLFWFLILTKQTLKYIIKRSVLSKLKKKNFKCSDTVGWVTGMQPVKLGVDLLVGTI